MISQDEGDPLVSISRNWLLATTFKPAARNPISRLRKNSFRRLGVLV